MLRTAGLSRIVLLSALFDFAAGSLTGCATLKSFTSKGMQLAGMKVAEVKQHAVTLNEIDQELMQKKSGGELDKLEVEPTNYVSVEWPELDAFSRDVAHIVAVVKLARKVIALSQAGDPQAVVGAKIIYRKASETVARAVNLVSSGMGIISSATSRLQDPKYLPIADDVLGAANDSVKLVKEAAEQLPALVEDLGKIAGMGEQQ
jgi:hypothetical protein